VACWERRRSSSRSIVPCSSSARACSARSSTSRAARRSPPSRSGCSGPAEGPRPGLHDAGHARRAGRRPAGDAAIVHPGRRGRHAPSALARVHGRYHTPHVAIVTYAAVSCALAVSGTFRPLAILASVSLLLIYLAVCLAALKLRFAGPAPAGAFRAPGGPLVPALGAVTVVWLLAHTTRTEAAGLAITVGGLRSTTCSGGRGARGRPPAPPDTGSLLRGRRRRQAPVEHAATQSRLTRATR